MENYVVVGFFPFFALSFLHDSLNHAPFKLQSFDYYFIN